MSKTERFVEVARCAMTMDVALDVKDLREIAAELEAIKHDDRGCLRPGGSGVWIWVKSRLMERGKIRPGKLVFSDEPAGTRLTVELHFWPWDEARYGPWKDKDETRPREPKPAASKLQTIAEKNGNPIDATAAKVARRPK